MCIWLRLRKNFEFLKFYKEKKELILFIKNVYIYIYHERYPDLYNVSDPAYKNKSRRESLLQQIKGELNAILNIDVPTSDIKKKINGLRTQYFKELNLIKKSESSSASTSQFYQPKLWCFELLNFLRSGHKTRESESNLTQADVEDEPLILTDDQIDDTIIWDTIEAAATDDVPLDVMSPTSSRPSTSSKSTIKRKRDKEESDTANDVLVKASRLLEELHQPTKELYNIDTLAMWIASELRNIKDPEVLRHLKRTITDAIFNAQEQY